MKTFFGYVLHVVTVVVVIACGDVFLFVWFFQKHESNAFQASSCVFVFSTALKCLKIQKNS